MSVAYDTVHERLVTAVPEFRPALAEHVADYAEVLQHLLFGDLTRFTLAAHEAGDSAIVNRVLDFLATEWEAGDVSVQELIAVSFVENVGPWEERQQRFISTWPRSLRAEAQRQRDWKPA